MPLWRDPDYHGRRIANIAPWMHPNMFLGAPLVLAGQATEFWRGWLDHADRAAGGAFFAHFPQLPGDGASTAALLDLCRRQKRLHRIVLRESRALLRHGPTPDAHLAGAMSGKKRKELRRQRHRLEEAGRMEIRRSRDAQAIAPWIEQFLALEQRGWKGREGSALADHADSESFFRQALAGAAREGRLERLSLELDGRPLAMLASFLGPPGSFAFKTCFDETFARYSPGMLLQVENLALLEDDRLAWCDSCAAADHPMIERIWRDRRDDSVDHRRRGQRLAPTVRRAVGPPRSLANGATQMSETPTQPAAETRSGVFPQASQQLFARMYPENPHVLAHRLGCDPRLELEGLAQLAGQLPPNAIEYNRGNLPIGVADKPVGNGRTIEDTIRHIATSDSWAVLKNIEQVPAYRELLLDLLEELRPVIESRTGAMLTPQGFVFISSPDAVTPYHFDPEHNILLQLKGSKVMTQFPAGDPELAPDTVHESYHLGGPRELGWRDAMLAAGTEFALAPGDAVYVPVMAPHFVRNGPDSSISLSITWRSEWSYAEADARCFNAALRRFGMNPRPPGRWPSGNRFKALAWRGWRRAFGDGI